MYPRRTNIAFPKKSAIRTSRLFSTDSNTAQWRTTFEKCAKQNNLSVMDWYQISDVQLDPETSEIIRKDFRGSLYRALSAVFPEVEWHPWKFAHHPVPKGFWTKTENQRSFFNNLGKTLGISSLDDWYEKLSAKTMLEHGGSFLLNPRNYNASPAAALMAAFPEHNWVPWKFNKVPTGYWNDLSNQRKFFEDLGPLLGIRSLDDWYEKLSKDLLRSHGGNSLLARYNDSPSAVLMAVYPDHAWIPWKFNNVPLGFWKDKANQRRFFDDLGAKIGIKTLDDWYNNVSSKLIRQHGGRGILNVYSQSPMAAVMGAYPDHNWIPWKFNSVPLGYWKWKENVKDFLTELSEKLSIRTLDDWYRVDYMQLKQFGGTTLLTRYRGLYQLLKEQYPHHPWDPKKFQQKGKKAQRWLAVTLKKLYPNEEILEDYMHPKVVLPATNRPLQLDVFIPSKSLAFEYQGIQHYQEIGVFNPSQTYQRRDEEKRTLCASNNIKLIEVPYWWNRTQESLQELMTTQ